MALKYVVASAVLLAMAAIPSIAQGQSFAPDDKPPTPHIPVKLPSLSVPGCGDANTTDLTFKNRFCYEAKTVISTGAMFRAFAGGGYSEWAPVPRGFDHDSGMFVTHVEYFYSRRVANAFGELVGGQLNHEAIESQPSGKDGIWNRTRSALWSVARIQDDHGSRIAIAPIAGSLASGLVTLGCCGYARSPEAAFRRAGVSYAGYFATALFREFKPDLKSYARRKFRR